MNHWLLVQNPGYTGEPRIMTPACHDGTPFLTFKCPWCQGPMHLHESQVDGLPPRVVIDARCPEMTCHAVSEIRVSFVRMAFEKMRRDGWLAP